MQMCFHFNIKVVALIVFCRINIWTTDCDLLCDTQLPPPPPQQKIRVFIHTESNGVDGTEDLETSRRSVPQTWLSKGDDALIGLIYVAAKSHLRIIKGTPYSAPGRTVPELETWRWTHGDYLHHVDPLIYGLLRLKAFCEVSFSLVWS